jgi:hypothetical protein
VIILVFSTFLFERITAPQLKWQIMGALVEAPPSAIASLAHSDITALLNRRQTLNVTATTDRAILELVSNTARMRCTCSFISSYPNNRLRAVNGDFMLLAALRIVRRVAHLNLHQRARKQSPKKTLDGTVFNGSLLALTIRQLIGCHSQIIHGDTF